MAFQSDQISFSAVQNETVGMFTSYKFLLHLTSWIEAWFLYNMTVFPFKQVKTSLELKY